MEGARSASYKQAHTHESKEEFSK